jgi:hypothetical protein
MEETEKAWLGGLFDAEGSFGLRRHPGRKSQVICSAFLGMSDEPTMSYAKQLCEQMYGAPLTLHVRAPRKLSKKPLYSFNAVSKVRLLGFLRALIPYLRFKRTEAILQYDFLSRAAKGRHISTEHDLWLCEMSRRLKREDDAELHRCILERVRDDLDRRLGDDDTEAAWLAGYTDGDGCVGATSERRGQYHYAQLVYGSARRSEIEFVRELASQLCVAGSSLPQVSSTTRGLSKKLQWRILFRGKAAEGILAAVRPHLFTKQLQAELALLILESPGDTELRARCCEMIQALNSGTTSAEDADQFVHSQRHPGSLATAS